MLLLFKATTKKTNMLKKMYIQLDEKRKKNRNWFNAQLTDDMKANLFFVLKSGGHYQVESTKLDFSAMECNQPFLMLLHTKKSLLKSIELFKGIVWRDNLMGLSNLVQ